MGERIHGTSIVFYPARTFKRCMTLAQALAKFSLPHSSPYKNKPEEIFGPFVRQGLVGVTSGALFKTPVVLSCGLSMLGFVPASRLEPRL